MKSYDSEFLKLILEYIEKPKREIADKQIREEIEKVRLRVEALERDVV